MKIIVAVLFIFFLGGSQPKFKIDKDKGSEKTLKVWDKPKRGINGTKLVYYSWDNKVKRRNKFYLKDSFYQKISDWNINLVRCFIGLDKDPLQDYKKFKKISEEMEKDELLSLYEDHFIGLDKMLFEAEKFNFEVVITLGKIGGRFNNENIFENNLFYIWDHISKKYGDHPKLIGYDLLNEPNTSFEKSVWNKPKTINKLIDVIRKNDDNTFIIIEPCPWGVSRAFNNVPTIKNKHKLIYSPHFYEPHTYTHQGIKKYKNIKNLSYPGNLKDYLNSIEIPYTKKKLLEILAPVIAFQKRNKCKIYVGEFGVARWAAGGDRYLSDLIEIFEKFNWSWTYHSYGEPYNGFNPTFTPEYSKISGIDGGKITNNLKVLLEGWKKNNCTNKSIGNQSINDLKRANK